MKILVAIFVNLTDLLLFYFTLVLRDLNFHNSFEVSLGEIENFG